MNRPLRERYDVVVLGGAFSGASTAMLLKRDHPEVSIVVASVDRGLNEHGFILPGLGDAGDRLYGTR